MGAEEVEVQVVHAAGDDGGVEGWVAVLLRGVGGRLAGVDELAEGGLEVVVLGECLAGEGCDAVG